MLLPASFIYHVFYCYNFLMSYPFPFFLSYVFVLFCFCFYLAALRLQHARNKASQADVCKVTFVLKCKEIPQTDPECLYSQERYK